MPPLGKWLRPIIAASVTAAIGLGSYFAKAYAEGDIKRLAAKYPVLAAEKGVKDVLAGFPVIGGILSFIAGPFLDPVAEQAAGMSEADKSTLKMDYAIITWAPIIGTAGLAVGGIVTLYFVWKDLIESPAAQARREAATSAAAVGTVAVLAPPAAPFVAKAAEAKAEESKAAVEAAEAHK